MPAEEGDAAPPAEVPTGVDAPQGAAPEVLRPGTTMTDERGTNDAPSDGAPPTGENPAEDSPTAGTGPAPRQDENVDTGTDPIESQGSTSMAPNADTQTDKAPNVVIIPRSGGSGLSTKSSTRI